MSPMDQRILSALRARIGNVVGLSSRPAGVGPLVARHDSAFASTSFRPLQDHDQADCYDDQREQQRDREAGGRAAGFRGRGAELVAQFADPCTQKRRGCRKLLIPSLERGCLPIGVVELGAQLRNLSGALLRLEAVWVDGSAGPVWTRSTSS